MILDGPLGTELEARGVPTPLPGWSAHALETHPEVVAEIHRDYAAAGATVHTTNTFRTRPSVFGDRWSDLARQAVRLTRDAVPASHRVAGSIAPLEDCYRPDLSPADTDPDSVRAQHGALARVLAEEGCDILLVETFPHLVEARIALEEAVATGVETWISWTPGPNGDLLTVEQVEQAAAQAINLGARGMLVNCLPVQSALSFVETLLRARAAHEVAVGAYANTGCVDDTTGWTTNPIDPGRYAEFARTWLSAGATIVGGCCGTGPNVTTALRSN